MRSWIKRAGEAAGCYRDNKAELKKRRSCNLKCRAVFGVKAKGIVRPVEAEVISIAEDSRINQLEREIEAVDWAFLALERVGASAAPVIEFADLLYRKRTHLSVERVADIMFISRNTAFRYNRMFLKLVASRLGIWAPPGAS